MDNHHEEGEYSLQGQAYEAFREAHDQTRSKLYRVKIYKASILKAVDTLHACLWQYMQAVAIVVNNGDIEWPCQVM